MKDDNCIFCKLANGDIPTNTVYEDEYLRAIMDASPANKGHIIILPKSHAANIYELENEYIEKSFVLAKKLAAALKKLLNCDGVNILQNNGEAAGQTVFHFHVHVIPRYLKAMPMVKLLNWLQKLVLLYKTFHLDFLSLTIIIKAVTSVWLLRYNAVPPCLV